MVARWCLFAGVTLVPFVLLGHAADPVRPHQLWVDEADAVVELYEIRLHNVRMRADQEDLKWNQVKTNYERMSEAHKRGAVNERDFRDAKYEYDYWTLQDRIKDVAEAETNLKLAKIRKKMAEAGERPYGTVAGYGRE